MSVLILIPFVSLAAGLSANFTDPTPATPQGWVLSTPKNATVTHADGKTATLNFGSLLYAGDVITLPDQGDTIDINGFGKPSVQSVATGYKVADDLADRSAIAKTIVDDVFIPLIGTKGPHHHGPKGGWNGYETAPGTALGIYADQKSTNSPPVDLTSYFMQIAANVKNPAYVRLLRAQADLSTGKTGAATFEFAQIEADPSLDKELMGSINLSLAASKYVKGATDFGVYLDKASGTSPLTTMKAAQLKSTLSPQSLSGSTTVSRLKTVVDAINKPLKNPTQ